ncbi:glycosyltransferase family 4 protein [Maribellus sp. YY47]|uniref:glycosyltransferase family 4 protein n=1 Tax=Maribellus sp. YY47 TaxID=2929486 RepID=UPI0020008AEC|nr:glycosyltransferase family 4 protein [Maribellus sp. YY47]MCK3683750.1 glycosyltransferase family 4 protein [Maribellus sp. YY47]
MNKERKKNILLVYNNFSTFVKTDFDILSAKFEVEKYQYKPVKGLYKNALEFIKQMFYLTVNIRKFDAVYIWFGDYHSFLPVLFAKVFRKKSFLVIGGYDVARIKHLKYGVFTSKLRGFFALYSMNNCTVNLTVSKYVERKVNWIAKKANTELIYNCVTLNKDIAKDGIEKEDLTVTVGIIEKEQTFYIKGIDTFIEVARLLPEYKFLIVGLNWEKLAHLLKDLPANITIKGKVPHEELIAYYQRAKIYCQLSRSESFGVALAEAMYFGCSPIVTNVGGLPEVVNVYGFKTKRNISSIANTIDRTITNHDSKIESIATFIQTTYSIERRNLLLTDIISRTLR